MFDISSINKRYFEITITVMDDEYQEHKLTLEVKPPKVKVMKKLISVATRDTEDEETVADLQDAVKRLLSNNKDQKVVPLEIVGELNIDELKEIVIEYSKWLGQEKESKN